MPNVLNMVYILRFFPSKCSLFHNYNLFGSCIIHILYTGCAKINKNNSGAKRLMRRPWPALGRSATKNKLWALRSASPVQYDLLESNVWNLRNLNCMRRHDTSLSLSCLGVTQTVTQHSWGQLNTAEGNYDIYRKAQSCAEIFAT